MVGAEHARLTGGGLAPVDERDTTCCYARQDKFWVQGAPDGERWEIYTVLEDSPTFWGEAGEQSWQAAEGALDAGSPGGQCGRAGCRAGLAVLRGRAGEAGRPAQAPAARLTGPAPCREMEA